MTEGPNIKYIRQHSIDQQKWDACIAKSENGLIYAHSFYLNKMSDHWDALVMDDYDFVMPLTWKKKYGIYYLYQPFLAAQLGVFGNNINDEILNAFLKAIPQKFKYIDIYLNRMNVFPLNDFNLYQRNNFVLDLNKPYPELAAAYRDNVKRNIQKANKQGCSINSRIKAEAVIDLAKLQIQHFHKNVDRELNSFKELYQLLHDKGQAVSYGVLSPQLELLASAIFFFSNKRAYYILVGNHPNGKTLGASHALIDAFIKDYAGNDLLLDFEGSDIRNLAFFYSSFGAVEEKYAGLKINRLPWYVKWLKK